MFTKLKRKISSYCLLFCYLLIISACGSSSPNSDNNVSAPENLKVGEGFINPIGYYERSPRFSWQLAINSKTKFQKAYQIQVSSSETNIAKADLWDSLKQSSAQNAWVPYQGKALASRDKIFWRVRIWDEQNNQSKWSNVSSLELGLLENSDWQAKWIRHPETGETFTRKYRKSTVENKLYRPQYLRTNFAVKPTIKQARLYITSKGIFESYLNGKKVSDHVMTPGWTPYLKRIETLTYDVTTLLNEGENTLAAIVAEGWYSGRILSPQKREVDPSALLAQLEIHYTDGSKQTVVSDHHWKATIQGPIRLAGNYDGETYDANYEMSGWNTANFNDTNWQSVITEAITTNVALAPKRHNAAKTKLIIPAIDIITVAEPKPDIAVFDMGQNMLGVPELTIPVIAGQQVTIRFSEALEHNTFYTENLRSALATDVYIPAKTGIISYTPTFTFHGYRYVEIAGFDQSQKPALSWVKGLVQHSDFNVTANFTSSHSKLNKLADNVVWGLRGNFLDIPTDCPQRDERLGWTGDAQVFAGPSMYMADVYGFWSAWLQSIREEQDTDGRVPNFIPTKQNKHTKGASSGWGDVAIIIPWELYLLTGDKHILAENYQMIQGWLNYHQAQSKDFISHMESFSDWLQPYPLSEVDAQARRGDTPKDLISTAYYARALDYAAKVAKVLEHHDDAKHYAETFKQVKQAFRHKFYDEQTKVVSVNTQTSYLLPLAFNLFDGDDIKNAQQHLIATIANADNHLRTGFLGTPLLAPVLQGMGRSDLMYELLFKESYPSWFYSINNGATTTWERWNSYSLSEGFSKASMNSLNHYAYGAVAKWFYEGILGITPTTPGFKTIKIAPQFGTKLTNASGSYKTPQGTITVDWKVNNAQLAMMITIPKNSTADIELPQVNKATLSLNGVKVTSTAQLLNLTAGQYNISGSINF